MSWAIDHLIVAASTLAEGAAWCEARFGVAPRPGGKHPLMGTHNRLLALGGEAFPRSYLEIIAIDPEAPAPARRRWFDLDDAALRRALADGPRLIHWVARCTDVAAECAVLARAGIDRGEVLAAERDTPQGRLRWRIAVRPDGQRLFGGALPTLIEWGAVHPADHLPPSPLRLRTLELPAMPEAVQARLPSAMRMGTRFAAEFDAPVGVVRLEGLS